MTDQDHIERINALTRNARNTWFALLGVLVFVGITLMGVEHIDFYGVNRATKLPLVDVEVPTKSFFFAAPVLTAAIFGYFHLYLIRLWDALGAAPAMVNEQPLGDAIAPWLVTDAALHLRKDACTTSRVLEGPAMLLNLALAWGFGLGILGWLWIASMPARDIWITGVAGVALLVSVFAGASSLAMLFLRLRSDHNQGPTQLWSSVPAMASLVVLIPAIASCSHMRTMGAPDDLAALDLSDQNLVEKPPGWLPYDIARKDFLAVWCKREGVDCKGMSEAQQRDFAKEWKIRRDVALADLIKPDWHKADRKPNLGKSNLFQAFLSGADLSEAKLNEAQLKGAHLEGVFLTRSILTDAQLEGAELTGASLQGSNADAANFSEATMQRAILTNTSAKKATFTRAFLSDAELSFAELNEAFLYGASLDGATLFGVNLDGGDLSAASLKGVDLSLANLNNASFVNAKIQDADLNGADLSASRLAHAIIYNSQIFDTKFRNTLMWATFFSGEHLNLMSFSGTDFSGADASGAAFRFVDLSGMVINDNSEFANIFLDETVVLPESFREKMGGLCQRVRRQLSDLEYFGRWRGWLEAGGKNWGFNQVPPGWEDVTPIPPPEGCEWKTGPMPGAE